MALLMIWTKLVRNNNLSSVGTHPDYADNVVVEYRLRKKYYQSKWVG